MMLKRGISEVITTVLIILLAIAAVVIIWSFIRPTITNAGQSVQGASECFSVQVKPTHCTSDGNITLQLVNGGGQGTNVTELVAIAENSSKDSKSVTVKWVGSTGDTVVIHTGENNTISATGYAKIAVGNGKTHDCTQSTEKILC